MNIRGRWLCYRHCHVTDTAIRCCTRPKCRGRRQLRALAYDNLMAHLLAVPYSPMPGDGNAPEPALMSCEAGAGSGAPPIAV